MRQSAQRVSSFHIQVYIAVTRPGHGLPWLAWTAFVVGTAAVALEFVADLQMHRFVAAARPAEVMDRGLWGWSRHPNYFGGQAVGQDLGGPVAASMMKRCLAGRFR